MELNGIDGSHLFGFMTALGILSLLDDDARVKKTTPPRLCFNRSGTAKVDSSNATADLLVDTLFEKLQASRPFYERELSLVKKPTDFTLTSFAEIAGKTNRAGVDILSGLACCVGSQTFESTLCAANGASHQNLIQSIRDILALVEREHLHAALFEPWRKQYEVPDSTRKRLLLGTRKPTLRLDPADERLYALRFSNPTTAEDFKTELGAQALAVPAFSLLPVLPMRRPVSVASERTGNHVWFSWPLWSAWATLATVRSMVVLGVERRDSLIAKGAFAAYRAARVSGAKGKLSFAPTEGVW